MIFLMHVLNLLLIGQNYLVVGYREMEKDFNLLGDLLHDKLRKKHIDPDTYQGNSNNNESTMVLITPLCFFVPKGMGNK